DRRRGRAPRPAWRRSSASVGPRAGTGPPSCRRDPRHAPCRRRPSRAAPCRPSTARRSSRFSAGAVFPLLGKNGPAYPVLSNGFLPELDKSPYLVATMTVTVAARTVTAPAFGAWLKALRGDRSREQIARQLRPYVKGAGLKLDQSLLSKIEDGRLPSGPILGALSRVYAVPIKETTERLRASIVFPGSDHLFRQAVSDVQEEERPDDAAASPRSLDADTARILSELTDACLAFHDLSVTCQDISTRLA